MADVGTIEVHTSDRQLFKRCRRRWNWQSTLRANLIRVGPDYPAFFLGTGFHFALEDYWGYRRFAHPALAFAAYYDAQSQPEMPDEAEDLLDLATGMLMYYTDEWLKEHPEPYETLVIDGKPQVEVEVAIDITDLLLGEAEARGGGLALKLLTWLNGRRVHYITTYDRVVIERHEVIYGLDYKTAVAFDELNLQTNPQAGAYDWSMDLFYTPVGYKPGGIIWQQHVKKVPEPPRWVNKGKANEGFSLAFAQSTTYRLYRRAVVERYGTIPERYNGILANLADMQDENGDRFVRREVLRRNDKQREAEQEKIVAEVLEMLDPGLPLYPNFTDACKWDCPFREPCLAVDDGSDVDFMLSTNFEQVRGYKDDWRKRIKWPDPEGGEPSMLAEALA